MSERKYTLQEIDAMRDALEAMSLHSLCPGGHGSWSGDYEKTRVRDVERRLRTYMLAGIDPKELEDEAIKQGC